jgi:Cu-Zn family superoxide dismutase
MTTKIGSIVLLSTVAACASPESRLDVRVELEPRSGTNVRGRADFVESGTGVEVTVEIANASPGLHGLHVHQVPDCSAPDAESAGEHWNPEMHPHAAPTTPKRHLGDLGNISVGADGRGKLRMHVVGLTVRPSARSVVGHSLIVHAAADDMMSQPSGNAGARIACGVIRRRG